jgi:hypothetical protein
VRRREPPARSAAGLNTSLRAVNRHASLNDATTRS